MTVALEMERIAPNEGAPLIERLGDVPCPSPSCNGTGSRVRIGTRVMDLVCSKCSEIADRIDAENDHAESVTRLLSRAGGTARMEAFSYDSYFTDAAGQAAVGAVTRWRDRVIEDRKAAPNLFLCGPVGCGKTGLMWPVVKSFCESLIPAKIVDFPTLLEDMRQSFSKKVPFDTYSGFGRTPVLVLDDIGAERPTEWTLSQLLYLVNSRYERRLVTAYVSNYDPDDLVEDRLNLGDRVISERIVSRMVEGAIQHRIEAPSRRQIGQAA